jgi:predicted  nucleic acid-binding Zn-ribbon protein
MYFGRIEEVLMFLLLQAGSPPAWVGPAMAVSLIIIAMAFVVIAAAIGLAIRQAGREMHQLSKAVEELHSDLRPAVVAVQAVSDEGRRLAGLIGGEAEELVGASRALRQGLQKRIANLEAVYEVLEEEVEETALDVAVTLRTFRSGAGWYARLRRLMGRGRRR